jgi:hypothetical protein
VSRTNDAAIAGLLTMLFWAAVMRSFSRTPWWTPEYTDKGGRGAGPGATTTPVPQGGANLWSETTMRMFAEQMYRAGIDARLVLLGIAASSNFNADTALGNNTGLLALRREHLAEVGYPEDGPAFETRDAVFQIPWIAKVISYRIASTGGRVPATIPDLAELLHPSSPELTTYIRSEAEKRAESAKGKMLYIAHDNLLRRVLRNP